MRHYKIALVASNKILTDMSTTINGPAMNLDQTLHFSFHAKWTGTPTGSFKLQGSNDVESTVTDWEDIPGSTLAVAGAAGTQMWNYADAPFRWVRIVYTATSGTGTLSKCLFSAKGV